MDDETQPARRFVKARLLEIQRCADDLQRCARWALQEIARLDEIRIRRWRCVHCGYVICFTKPATIEGCGKCAMCGGTKFAPDGEIKAEEAAAKDTPVPDGKGKPLSD